jgi:hypothetical protein
MVTIIGGEPFFEFGGNTPITSVVKTHIDESWGWLR